MPIDLSSLGMQAAQQTASGVIGAGMGLLLEKHNDKRQLKQQGKLQALEIAGQQQMADYNLANQIKLWNATNYSAQMDQLKKAGLNPALLYGMGGAGGSTAAANTGDVTGAEAPKGGQEIMQQMGMGLNLALLKAQKENIEADTRNKEADTQNKPLQGANIEATTGSILQGINESKARQALAESETAGNNIRNAINQGTIEEQIQIITANMATVQANATKAEAENFITQATKNTIVDRAKLEAANVYLQGLNIKADTKLKTAQTDAERQQIQESQQRVKNMQQQLLNLQQEISTAKIQNYNSVAQLSINEKLAGIQSELKDFNIYDKPYIDMVSNAIGALAHGTMMQPGQMPIPKGTTPPEVKGFGPQNRY